MYTKESIFPLDVGKCSVNHKNSEFPKGEWDGIKSLDGVFGNDCFLDNEAENTYPISDCTLLLKPLSKMSEEDCKDFAINVANATEREWESNKGARESTIEELRDLASSRLGTLTESVPVVLWLISHGYAISDELFELNIAEETNG